MYHPKTLFILRTYSLSAEGEALVDVEVGRKERESEGRIELTVNPE